LKAGRLDARKVARVVSLIWRVKPYRLSLFTILLAMLLQMLASVAAPWPLKVVLDNVVGEHKLPHWLDDSLRPFMSSGTKVQIAAAAAVAVVLIAFLGAMASYVANYYTTSVGQWGGERSTPPDLPPSATTLAQLLQHP
jgi:ABC-type multidrug transport system fused ATPase/permease subunit